MVIIDLGNENMLCSDHHQRIFLPQFVVGAMPAVLILRQREENAATRSACLWLKDSGRILSSRHVVLVARWCRQQLLTTPGDPLHLDSLTPAAARARPDQSSCPRAVGAARG